MHETSATYPVEQIPKRIHKQWYIAENRDVSNSDEEQKGPRQSGSSPKQFDFSIERKHVVIEKDGYG